MPYFFLQSNELAEDVWWIGGTLVILTLAYFYYRRVLRQRAEREAINHDPRSHVVNDTNYNINRKGIDGHRAGDMNAEEADEVLEKLRAADSIPSREEFRELREDLRRN